MTRIRSRIDQWVARLLGRNQRLTRAWARRWKALEYESVPWTPFEKELADCKVALVTSGGVHLVSQIPYDMEDRRGDPSFREIPFPVSRDELRITHNYYDHSDADRDINVILPLDRLRELLEEGALRASASFHFSFMGHIIGSHIGTLVGTTAPEVCRRLVADQVDLVFLTPA